MIMYNILVVDDEQIVIDSVRFIVKNNIRNAAVCAGFRSGAAALQQIGSLKPDIVLMDICMPGINGLDTIAQMKLVCPNAVYVIISAYEQFEFAKQAVELDVYEYLLKPVKKQVLVDVINRIMAEISDRANEFNRALKAEEKFKNALSVLEPGLIYSIIMNRNPAQALKNYRELSGITTTRGYIMVLKYEFGEKKARGAIEDEPFFLVFREILKIRRRCILGPAMSDRTAVYIFCDDDDYQSRVKAAGFAEGLLRELKKKSGIAFSIGIGGVKDDDQIAYSYEEALIALRHGRGEVAHIAEAAGVQPDNGADIISRDAQLLEAVEAGDADKVDTILRELFDRMDRNSALGCGNSESRNRLIEIAVMAHRAAHRLNVGEDDYLKFNSYLGEMLEIKDSNEFKEWYIMRMVYLAMKIRKAREASTGRIVSQAKAYISDNYGKQISLNMLAKSLGVSPSISASYSRRRQAPTLWNT